MYYIYHIPGKKIGCTKNPKSRIKQQGVENYEILETHTDIHIASKREMELQKEYGYKVDSCTYYDSTKEFKIENVIKAGQASATKSWKENRERELQKSSKGGKAVAAITGKPVIMCDINGNPIKEFVNRHAAARFVKGFVPPLLQAIDNPNKSYKGYRWINLLNNKTL
jgi:uncharacterized lipoprotein NlpE involved in copper resistance